MFNLTKQDLEQNKAMNTATEIFSTARSMARND